MKKIIIMCCIVIFAAGGLSAQQITKFGVVDTAKVYNAYFRDSSAVRNYERRKEDYQKEINKLTEELRTLQQRKLSYENSGDDSNMMRLESEITRKAEYLREYTNAKNIELATMQKSLQDSNSFYRKLYDVLARVAESGGYSMILSLQQNNAILWYSPSVDVTQQVIDQISKN
ncbi:MAG: OmpH family outer membrane protein [Treponema sp.]|nr:OmpH family outer membrane protein [Treponema sp.]